MIEDKHLPTATVGRIRTWWPWFVLSLGVAIIALGGFLLSLHGP